MHDLITVAITVFMGFFAMMNPFANTAVFVGMTGGMPAKQTRAIAVKALVTAFCIITTFCFLGKGIFSVFGITLPALRLAGGVLVFLVGYHMLQGNTSSMHETKEEETSGSGADIAISPLALPLLAGPGTIATAMNYSAAGGMFHILVTVSAFALLCVITFFCFIYGPKLIEKIGQSGISIITRLMGLILAVIGMQMGIQGVHDAIVLFSSAK